MTSRLTLLALLLSLLVPGPVARAQQAIDIRTDLVGRWVINDSLSQNTDEQVEAAIKAAGGKVQRRWFGRKEEDRYRGGPAEHELYDRISYDDELTIAFMEPEFTFVYEDGYQRVFYSDGRSRSTGVTDYFQQGGLDNSFAEFDGDALLVEARPRDGGYTEETYVLEADGTRLRVELVIKPANFGAPIKLVRVFDRAP
ncbi:MAG: hypothetical protein RLZZ385_1939 [Pseudomonadota bacterium]|jgi:hypothetical protein